MSEQMGWQRVLTSLSCLVGFLLLVWLNMPKSISNVGKLINSITTFPESWIIHIETHYQFFVFLFSMFVICMGMARWAGKRLWYDAKISWRRKLKLPVASLFSPGGSASSFSYGSLLQGGFIGLGFVSLFLLYGILGADKDKDVLQMFSKASFLASLMLLLWSLSFSFTIWSRQDFIMLSNSPVLIIVTVIIIIIILTSFFFDWRLFARMDYLLESQTMPSSLPGQTLPRQILSVAILSLCFSYTYGMTEGLKAADPESTYPLVSIEVIQGPGFDEAWLYDRTDSDYRIVTKSGSNHIIPASNVKQIKGL